MGAVEADLLSVIDRFQAAALGDVSWLDALDGFARATGSRSGQIIGLGAAAAVPFNWMTEMPPESVTDFLDAGGGDPRVNRRVALGGAAAEGRILTDGDFPAYGRPDDPLELRGWVERYDVPHICLSPLIKGEGLLVGLAAMRTHRQGHFEAEDRKVFARLAPHIRSAVRTQMLLADQGSAVLSGALAALQIAAFICDGRGAVLGRTPLTEPLLEAGVHVRLRGGRLSACNEADGRLLSAEIVMASRGGPGGLAGSVVLRDVAGLEPLLADVVALPRERHPFALERPVLVLVRRPRDRGPDAARLAVAMYDLTRSESLVAGDLVEGLSPQMIADRRGTAVTTVRTHVRRIFEKAGVTSQIELVAALNRRL
ncbi:hypothetical protein ASC65_13255 [Brevundimonas sp. Root1279]|nr:hypothetical protein ASC65_13255 [Brevundimonas sp. Root1279]